MTYTHTSIRIANENRHSNPNLTTIVTTSIADQKDSQWIIPAILDRIMTGKYSKWINSMMFQARYRKHLAVHRSDDAQTDIPWTKSCNELPDENSPKLNLAIFDCNITEEFPTNQFGNDVGDMIILL